MYTRLHQLSPGSALLPQVVARNGVRDLNKPSHVSGSYAGRGERHASGCSARASSRALGRPAGKSLRGRVGAGLEG